MFRLSHLQNRHFHRIPLVWDRGLRGFWDCTDYPATLPNRFGLRANCDLRTTCVSCLNRGLRGLEDYTDYPTTPLTRFGGLRTTYTLRTTCSPTSSALLWRLHLLLSPPHLRSPIHSLCPTYSVCIYYTPSLHLRSQSAFNLRNLCNPRFRHLPTPFAPPANPIRF